MTEVSPTAQAGTRRDRSAGVRAANMDCPPAGWRRVCCVCCMCVCVCAVCVCDMCVCVLHVCCMCVCVCGITPASPPPPRGSVMTGAAIPMENPYCSCKLTRVRSRRKARFRGHLARRQRLDGYSLADSHSLRGISCRQPFSARFYQLQSSPCLRDGQSWSLVRSGATDLR